MSISGFNPLITQDIEVPVIVKLLYNFSSVDSNNLDITFDIS